MKYEHILFDLDGTLTDPKVGITKSVAYALNKLKDLNVDPEKLTCFIGPPLKDSFMEFYDMTEDEAALAIELYREYFKDAGMNENVIYEGIKEMMMSLNGKGAKCYVATSKPTVFAEVIIKNFGLESEFIHVVGSNLDGSRTRKSEVIQYVFDSASLDSTDGAVMIGDRKHDIIGAKEIGIESIGVRYGYGTGNELEEAGADYVVDSVKELHNLLFS